MAYRISDKHKDVKVKCTKCGHIFKAKVYRSEFDHLLKPHTTICPSCWNAINKEEANQ